MNVSMTRLALALIAFAVVGIGADRSGTQRARRNQLATAATRSERSIVGESADADVLDRRQGIRQRRLQHLHRYRDRCPAWHIKFGALAATKKACSEEVNAQEAAYFKALEQAQTFEIRATSLLINTKAFNEPLSFVPPKV